jgi:hypothetical protein
MSAPELNYAPRPPMHQRRVFQRWITAVILLAFVLSGRWWAGPAWRHLQLLYWQHRCMVYTPPKGQLVYDSMLGTQVVPKEWTDFYATLSTHGIRSNGIAFLHEMNNPNGQSRLVVLNVLASPRAGFCEVLPMVFDPGSMSASPREILLGPISLSYPLGSFHETKSFKVFGGSIDPLDHTHFSLACMEDGSLAFYDGWLQNDDTVSFGKRKSTARSK